MGELEAVNGKTSFQARVFYHRVFKGFKCTEWRNP